MRRRISGSGYGGALIPRGDEARLPGLPIHGCQAGKGTDGVVTVLSRVAVTVTVSDADSWPRSQAGQGVP
jgi:hypothetical protein